MILDEKLKQELKQLHGKLDKDGELLSKSQLAEYYNRFQQRFGPDKLKNLDGEALLDTMHNFDNKDNVDYWLEFKNDDEFPAKFGSIAGGSALKFGIYKRRKTGAWMTGSAQSSWEITIDEAIDYSRKQRDELIKGVELLEKLPQNGTDEDYQNLQKDMDNLAPTNSDTAWGHKYLSLLYPDKLDDYHMPDYQRFHLIKMLQIPPKGEGRFLVAGRFVSIANELGIPMNNLTTITNYRHGRPHQYWRIGTSNGKQPRNRWDLMRDGNCVAIGWANLGDLSEIEYNKASKEIIRKLMQEHHSNIPPAIGRQTQQVFNFVATIDDNDMVLACDGSTVLGIGRITGDYFYEPSSDFPHRRPVEWLNLSEWKLPASEGLQTVIHRMGKEAVNLVEVEKRIQSQPDPIEGMTRHPLPNTMGRIQSILNRKKQVIIYGPPGTGKTYWALNTAQELAAISVYKKRFDELSDKEKSFILSEKDDVRKTVRFCCFHPAYGYEDFIEGYRPESFNGQMVFTLRDGIFKQMCKDAMAYPQSKYYLIIDEINRGDIPRIFGELLAIMEKDKRGKPIILPLSGESFKVPENVFIIGTMNTADRSIALLDTALRRRFGFIELMPDISLLGNTNVAGIPLGPWLDSLNQRLREYVGRDARNLQIGHSYLLENGKPIKDFSKFINALRDDIIPLLEEYCYEDYFTLEKILGKGLINSDTQRVRYELFDKSKQEELVQALLAPNPEIITSSEAVLSESDTLEDDNVEEEEANTAQEY